MWLAIFLHVLWRIHWNDIKLRHLEVNVQNRGQGLIGRNGIELWRLERMATARVLGALNLVFSHEAKSMRWVSTNTSLVPANYLRRVSALMVYFTAKARLCFLYMPKHATGYIMMSWCRPGHLTLPTTSFPIQSVGFISCSKAKRSGNYSENYSYHQ